MNLKHILSAVAVLVCAAGCVYVDTSLGQDFIPIEQQYDVFTAEFPISQISLKNLTGLSGYSSRRITVGSLRDELFGLSTRSSAFTLVPVSKTMDFGANPRYRDFHISLARDTVSVAAPDQASILQNIGVYSLEAAKITLDSTYYSEDLKRADLIRTPRISKGVPVYDGGDSLSFSFTREFGEGEMSKLLGFADEKGVCKIDSLSQYTKKCPGIFLCCSDPAANGGRYNFFKVSVQQSSGYVSGSFAELKFTADYGDRKDVDTSFVFIFGATNFPEGSSVDKQFAFNVGESEGKLAEGDASAEQTLYVEGGCGLKPVISSQEIRDSLLSIFDRKGIKGDQLGSVVINKAAFYLPYDVEGDYDQIDWFPECLSPTCRIESEVDGKKQYAFANLADASISAENHGNINRSLCCYSPDIAFHAQQLIGLADDAKFENYDIWCMILATETTVKENENDEMTDYYNQLYYYSYLNQMYGGGYGYGGYGYGGYGGYGSYGYNNYYDLMYYSQMMNASSTPTVSQSSELDRDRYYRGKLTGPASTKNSKPMVKVTFAVPKSAEN